MSDLPPPDSETEPSSAAELPFTAVPPPTPVPPPTRGAVAIRRLLLFVAVGGFVLGAASLRHATLLRDRIDPDLVTTQDAMLADGVATVARLVLLALLVVLALTVRPWLRGVRENLRHLWDRGVIGTTVTRTDGSIQRYPSVDSPWLLLAPVPIAAEGRWWVTGVADSRRSARLAVGLGALAVGLIALGSVALAVNGSREVGSALWVVVGIGGFLLAPAGGLLAWLVADVDRREAAAIHVADPARPNPPDPEHRWAAAVIAALVAVAIGLPSINASTGLDDGRVCVVAEMDCRWMVVQADQLSNDPRGATTNLHYGLWRATGTRRGTMVLATGGPGYSGMASWEASYGSMDLRLTEAFDVVVFDARGVGQSGFVDCPIANQAYWEALSFDAAGSVIDGYATSCIEEAGVDPSRLAMYASAQVAEDIDAIREDLGVERIVLYGESYGTAVAQRYALAHPDRLDALILDAPLDITQSTDGFWSEAAASFEDILERTFRFCRMDDWCAEELPDPEAAWRRVMDRLASGTVVARYGDATGSMAPWEVSQVDAINVLGDALYDETGRSQVLRALAAGDRDDWVPLARLVHVGSWGDPYADISVSDFAYHATWCADRVVGADEAPDAGAYLESARNSVLPSERLGTVFLSGAACHGWPLAPSAPPPAALPASAAFPVIILTATGDPITPSAIGRRLAARYAATTDVYLIETTDGPHVTFGRGAPCPDDTVIALLLEGRRPLAHELHCDGELVYPYTGLVTKLSDEDGARYRARALDIELFVHPDYLAWDRTDELPIGCRFGGRLVVTAATTGDDIKVERCEVVEDSPMSGTGEYRDDGSVRFDVTFPRGRFRYDIGENGDWQLEGTFDGTAIDTEG